MDYSILTKAHALYESRYGNKFYRIALNVCQSGGIEEKTTAIASFMVYFNKVWYIYSEEGKKAFGNLEGHISDIYEVIKVTTQIADELGNVSIVDVNLNDIF